MTPVELETQLIHELQRTQNHRGTRFRFFWHLKHYRPVKRNWVFLYDEKIHISLSFLLS